MKTLSFALMLGLGGCAQSAATFPSLLPRAVEGQSLAEPDRPAPIATPDAALDAKIGEIADSLSAADKRFVASAQDAEAKVAVARGTRAGSERWLEAQAALSALDALRTPVAEAQANLERLVADRGAEGQAPYPALQAAAERANALSTAQQGRISALEAALAAT